MCRTIIKIPERGPPPNPLKSRFFKKVEQLGWGRKYKIYDATYFKKIGENSASNSCIEMRKLPLYFDE